jgi:hypothetical protein
MLIQIPPPTAEPNPSLSWEQVVNVFNQSIGYITTYLPNLLIMLGLVLAGLLLAALFRVLVKFFIRKLNAFIQKRWSHSGSETFISKSTYKTLGRFVFWIVFLFFVMVALSSLGLPAISSLVVSLGEYLPKVLAAILIVLAGFFASGFIRNLAIRAADSAGITFSHLIGRLVQGATVLVTLFLAITQLGFDITFLTTLIIVLVAILLGAGAISFSLGARHIVGNILASYQLQKIYKAGQLIRIDGQEGKILRISATEVLLEIPEGQLMIPAHRFGETASILLLERDV